MELQNPFFEGPLDGSRHGLPGIHKPRRRGKSRRRRASREKLHVSPQSRAPVILPGSRGQETVRAVPVSQLHEEPNATPYGSPTDIRVEEDARISLDESEIDLETVLANNSASGNDTEPSDVESCKMCGGARKRRRVELSDSQVAFASVKSEVAWGEDAIPVVASEGMRGTGERSEPAHLQRSSLPRNATRRGQHPEAREPATQDRLRELLRWAKCRFGDNLFPPNPNPVADSTYTGDMTQNMLHNPQIRPSWSVVGRTPLVSLLVPDGRCVNTLTILVERRSLRQTGRRFRLTFTDCLAESLNKFIQFGDVLILHNYCLTEQDWFLQIAPFALRRSTEPLVCIDHAAETVLTLEIRRPLPRYQSSILGGLLSSKIVDKPAANWYAGVDATGLADAPARDPRPIRVQRNFEKTKLDLDCAAFFLAADQVVDAFLDPQEVDSAFLRQGVDYFCATCGSFVARICLSDGNVVFEAEPNWSRSTFISVYESLLVSVIDAMRKAQSLFKNFRLFDAGPDRVSPSNVSNPEQNTTLESPGNAMSPVHTPNMSVFRNMIVEKMRSVSTLFAQNADGGPAGGSSPEPQNKSPNPSNQRFRGKKVEYTYRPLRNLSFNETCETNLIGIVTDVSKLPGSWPTRDFGRCAQLTLELTDPTVVQKFFKALHPYNVGKVTCTVVARTSEDLPLPCVGDIARFHRIIISTRRDPRKIGVFYLDAFLQSYSSVRLWSIDALYEHWKWFLQAEKTISTEAATGSATNAEQQNGHPSFWMPSWKSQRYLKSKDLWKDETAKALTAIDRMRLLYLTLFAASSLSKRFCFLSAEEYVRLTSLQFHHRPEEQGGTGELCVLIAGLTAISAESRATNVYQNHFTSTTNSAKLDAHQSRTTSAFEILVVDLPMPANAAADVARGPMNVLRTSVLQEDSAGSNNTHRNSVNDHSPRNNVNTNEINFHILTNFTVDAVPWLGKKLKKGDAIRVRGAGYKGVCEVTMPSIGVPANAGSAKCAIYSCDKARIIKIPLIAKELHRL